MVYRVFIWLLVVLLINGGDMAHAKKAPAKVKRPTLMDVYADSVGTSRADMKKFIDDKLVEQNTYGYVKPYVPVVQGPVVRKVWVPDQKSKSDPDVLVAGHWAYVMVQGPRWFIDTQRPDDEPAEIIVPVKPVINEDASGGIFNQKGKE